MPKLVAVFNAPPIYAAGLAGVLSTTGYALELVADPLYWLKRHRDCAVLVGIHEASDLDIVVDLKSEEPGSVVVTLVDEVDVPAIQASLSAGAAGSLSLNAPAAEVLLILNAAMSNNVVIPSQIAKTLARTKAKSLPPSMVEPHELEWLRLMAEGETVAELCVRVGYSEREMYRRLRRVYSRMGATGRTDALLKGARFGWFD